MKEFIDDNMPYKKKPKKKKSKKSDHKHDYELIEVRELDVIGWRKWFTNVEVCKICGKENNMLRIKKQD